MEKIKRGRDAILSIAFCTGLSLCLLMLLELTLLLHEYCFRFVEQPVSFGAQLPLITSYALRCGPVVDSVIARAVVFMMPFAVLVANIRRLSIERFLLSVSILVFCYLIVLGSLMYGLVLPLVPL